jgi:hypothetical protein
MNEDILPPEELARPYAERSTVMVEVSDDEKLGSFLTEAARQLGVSSDREYPYEPSHVGFYRPEDATTTPPVFAAVLPVLDGNGQARWTWRIREVTYGQVLESAEAGAIYGDPRRMHFALVPQVGNGVMPDWPAVVHVFQLLKQVLEAMAIPGGIAASYALIRDRLRKKSENALEVLGEHSFAWRERGADPHTLDIWLDERPWDPRTLGNLLGCSDAEAEAVLWAFGFGRGGDGQWHRAEDEDAKLTDGNRLFILDTGLSLASDSQLREELNRRAAVLAETGKAPDPPDPYEMEWIQEWLEDLGNPRFRARFGRFVGRWLDGLRLRR